MAKRVAQSSLNHMNWNEDEEPEEVGEFAKASEDVIKQRVIKKARRRADGGPDSTGSGSTPSVFGGFKGFSAAKPEETGSTTTGGTKSFSFLAGLGAAKPNGNTAAGSSAGGSTISSSTPMFSFGSNAGTTLADSSKKFTFGTPSNLKLDSTPAAVGDKPTSGFTFSATKDNASADRNKTIFGGVKSLSGEAATPTSTFSFGSTAPKSDATTSSADTKSTFTFGSAAVVKKDTPSEAGTATFSFGSTPAAKPAESAAAKTFTFGSSSAKDTGSGATDKKATFSFGMPAASKETVVVDKKSFSFGTAKETSEETVKKMFSFADTATKPAATADSGAESKKNDVPLGSLSQKKDGDGTDGAKKSSGFTFGSLPASSPSTLKTDSTDAASKKPVFGGFGITPSKEPAVAAEVPKQTFSFGSLPAKEPAVAEPKAPFAGFAGTTFGAKPSATTGATNKETNTSNANKEFEKNVVALNKSFITWVTKHVEANAFCKLHVVFKDYEKHFAKLESDKTAPRPAPAKEKESTEVVAKDKEKEVAKPMFSFGSIPKESPVKLPVAAAAATFSFGSSKPFSFGSPGTGITSTPSTTKSPTSSAAVSTFSPSFFAGASTFGSQPSAGGFSFGNVTKPAADTGKKDTDEGDGGEGTDEPPKVEFTPVEEKDSVYSKRCKLFVKAAGTYSDRGVGTVHIKQVDGKVQVLVRADTNLGNVLLNIILNESVPLQRMGKNNVMMICLPTPESKPPPTSVLLRVKTGPEADELYETLLKHKPK
ncbi:nuclear pore complex protein Nup50 [Anopheles cruzii]|uniref:nuclear pore complex protein Nup50 n=1 Tax=Anopheles cruzii TaxID=68878 RepID=UPI0022EC7855|nr:nuclear pore complex protein Nup50 [Anopheles cruzii]